MTDERHPGPADPVAPAPRLLLVTSNGAGMGHLTRLASVALAAGAGSATVLSLSVGLPLVARLGVVGEYCPSYERGWIRTADWHEYLRDRIVALAVETSADVVAFDGVAPYLGIALAHERLPDVPFAWVRRGMWRPGTGAAQLALSRVFDLIVEPGDLAATADRGPTATRHDARRVPPITMLEVVDRLPRAEAAAALGIDPARPTVLVTLGSGLLGEVAAPGTVVLRALLENPGWQICVTTPAVATQQVPVLDPDRVVELRGVFPLVRYLNVFDAAVSAAGYNATHELVSAGVPTLFVPNTATRTDDQVARADWLAAAGLALSAHDDDPAALVAAAERLADDALRAQLAETCTALPRWRRMGGASVTAELLGALGRDFEAPPRRRRILWQRMWLSTKAGVKRVMGDRATARVREMLGRPPLTDRGPKARVQFVAGAAADDEVADARALLMTDRIDTGLLRRDAPVEHILAASSEAYRMQRRRLVERYYDIVS